jgi:hypothetical protein
MTQDLLRRSLSEAPGVPQRRVIRKIRCRATPQGKLPLRPRTLHRLQLYINPSHSSKYCPSSQLASLLPLTFILLWSTVFYPNGPGHSVRQSGLKLLSGRIFFVPISKLSHIKQNTFGPATSHAPSSNIQTRNQSTLLQPSFLRNTVQIYTICQFFPVIGVSRATISAGLMKY